MIPLSIGSLSKYLAGAFMTSPAYPQTKPSLAGLQARLKAARRAVR